MSVTCGFYNSLNQDRKYDAIQMSSIFDGIIKDGIFMSIGDHFKVLADSGMNVTVGTGRAWFNHTWTLNDSLYPLTISPSEVVMDRIDAVVIEVNSTTNVRKNTIKVVKGTPASQNPKRPTMTKTAEVHQYPLAYITVNNNVTEIKQSNITSVIGTGSTPYVTGILETIDIESIVLQWESQWNEWFKSHQTTMNQTSDKWKKQWESWYNTFTTSNNSDFTSWSNAFKNKVTTWFGTIQGLLEGDPATNLASALSAHELKKDNPHSVTAKQAGALPITGGTVTGPISVKADTVEGTNKAYIGVQNSTGGTWVSLTSSADGSVSVYSSTKSKALVSMNAEGTVYLGGVAGPFLPISGGTVTGTLKVGEKLELRTDKEGGNIRITPPDEKQTTNKYWEIDAYNGNIRIYANTTAGTNVAALTLNSTAAGTQLNGNAATATKLATARTINGEAFDGTKAITVKDSTKLPLTGGTLSGDVIVSRAGAAYAEAKNTETQKAVRLMADAAGGMGVYAESESKWLLRMTPEGGVSSFLIKYGTKVPTGSDITAGQIYIQYS